jgi:hypothetical protein
VKKLFLKSKAATEKANKKGEKEKGLDKMEETSSVKVASAVETASLPEGASSSSSAGASSSSSAGASSSLPLVSKIEAGAKAELLKKYYRCIDEACGPGVAGEVVQIISGEGDKLLVRVQKGGSSKIGRNVAVRSQMHLLVYLNFGLVNPLRGKKGSRGYYSEVRVLRS